MGLPLRTLHPDARLERRRARRRASAGCSDRGWLDDGEALTAAGRAARESMEIDTDRAMTGAIEALGDDVDELVGILRPWGEAMRAAGGYVGGPVDLWPNRD